MWHLMNKNLSFIGNFNSINWNQKEQTDLEMIFLLLQMQVIGAVFITIEFLENINLFAQWIEIMNSISFIQHFVSQSK